MSPTSKHEEIPRELLLPLRYDSISLLDEEGWIAINHVLKLDFMKKFEADGDFLVSIGHGEESTNQRRTVYELDKSQTRIRSIKRPP